MARGTAGLGSNLYALGVPEKVIQQILRHANVATTNTYYIKTDSDQVTSAMKKLQQALPESLTGNEVATQKLERRDNPCRQLARFLWDGVVAPG